MYHDIKLNRLQYYP